MRDFQSMRAVCSEDLVGLVLTLVLSLLVGCTAMESDADPLAAEDAGPPAPGDEGYLGPCCVDGTLIACHPCPPGQACLPDAVFCDDGSCTNIYSNSSARCPLSPGVRHAPPAIGEGTWSRCCVGGVFSNCYCPPRVGCENWGLIDCGGGRCTQVLDATQVDAGACNAP